MSYLAQLHEVNKNLEEAELRLYKACATLGRTVLYAMASRHRDEALKEAKEADCALIEANFVYTSKVKEIAKTINEGK
jgi:hypothetical protein